MKTPFLLAAAAMVSSLPLGAQIARDRAEKLLAPAMERGGAPYFGGMFQGVLALEGDEKAVTRLVGKLEKIQESGRERCLQALGSSSMGGEAISALVRAFPDPADKVSYGSQQFSSFRPESSLAALKALDSPQLQTDALATAAARMAPHTRPGPPGEQTRARFNTAMDQLQFDPQARERIMATLAGSQTPQN